ncbi:MAG: hypothetical protein NT004_17585 [Bacteroidetes bacterium]|nr:hypothetical protein [Bacteroidota bacterium]
MKKYFLILCIPLTFMMSQCKPKDVAEQKNATQFIKQSTIDSVMGKIASSVGEAGKIRLDKGVKQCAALWTAKDGTEKNFQDFCIKYFVSDPIKLEILFKRLSFNWESLFGHFNMISLDLKRGMHLDIGEMLDVDEIFASYEPNAHFNDDFFNNKLAFVTAINFPMFTLKEKEELGAKWTRSEWAYARMGDMFTSRIPADVNVKVAEALTKSDNYISNYNIYVGNLVDDQMKTHFAKDMKLITHWNLRDELKANYNKGDEGMKKQEMIYEVMLHIINQDIPDSVINNRTLQWNPSTNKVYRDGKELVCTPEPDARYQYLLNNFKAMSAMDQYTPMYPTYIQRAFDLNMEIPLEQIEKLFTEFCSSPQVKQVGDLISKRLGRPLKPYDIWYDGFKARSSMNQDELDKITRAKYPNTAAFEADIPNILIKLGFKPDMAKEIASHIAVDPARGSGHAWGAQMKGDKAHLRTRISADGMNYKGYNIAVHELGHNVEQTISLYFVDNYMMQGVPNTAFTEAIAFLFQKRDLMLLGKKDDNPNKEALAAIDNFWMSYEIMGVSLIDMKVWQWLYANPAATKEQLKETVVKTAIEVWNQYYAPVFGIKDVAILGIYSHMIDNPLYLSNYPVGHLIDFQIDEFLKGKNFADEVLRIYSAGRLIPQLWMKNAVGAEISISPLVVATDEALKKIK